VKQLKTVDHTKHNESQNNHLSKSAHLLPSKRDAKLN